LAFLDDEGLRLIGVVGTHYHADHIGGDLVGHAVAGIAEIAARVDVPIHVQASETVWVTKGTGVGVPPVMPHEPGDVIKVGEIEITLLHTPGHTPGSQCLSFAGRLVSGDTLFVSGCVVLTCPVRSSADVRLAPGASAVLPDETLLFPGHAYSREPFATLGEIRATNAVLTPRSASEWLANFA